MRWQFGGNFQPVRMICEFDWRECPAAIANYVWSEIVTDVVECLTNEWIMWRVIAMLFVCTLLIHTIYSKAKLIDETTTNRKNLNVVGCKVQDLELKVNILTYKMQYGTWPLPRQIRGSGVERELRNVRLTLTNSNDRNAWLKHMLLSPTENATCVPYAKIGPRSVRCLTKLINLETKYMSSRFGRDASPLSQKEGRSSSSERSLKCATGGESRRSLVEAKKDAKSENLGARREESSANGSARRPTSWSETGVSKCRESARTPTRDTREACNEKRASRRSSRRDETPEERVNATSETLREVRKKLEELHSVLRIYGSASGEQAGEGNKRLAETILRDLKSLGGDLPESESDSKPRESSREAVKDANDLRDEGREDTTSDFEQCRSDFSSSSEIDKTRTCEEIATIPKKVKSSSSSLEKRDASSIVASYDKLEKSTSDDKCSMLEEAAASPISSAAEMSRDSDTDERSNALLLREALKFRSALVSRLELERSDRADAEAAEAASRPKLGFQPKFLDIISEEHSAGSSTEKSTRARELLGMGKCREAASSGLALASSSEYFSLSSIDLKTLIPSESRDEANLQDDLSDLVNRSVRNIRDYVEAFSRYQNDAIAETRRAISEEDAAGASLDEVSPRGSLDSVTRFVNTLAITMSEELPRELSEPALPIRARLENIEDSRETSGSTGDFDLERRPGTISLTDKGVSSFEEIGPRLHDTIHESLDSDELSLSSGPSCKQMSRDYSEGTTSDSLEPQRRVVDTSLAILEDENSPEREQDASRALDSPLTGRTVVRATASNIDDLGISDSAESFEDRKNSRPDDTTEVNSRDEPRTRESNVVRETSSLYFTDQASFPDIEKKFFDVANDRLTGIESGSSILDDTDRSYGKPEVGADNASLVDGPEVERKFENGPETEVGLDSEGSSGEPEAQFEYENEGKPETEPVRLAARARASEEVRPQFETTVEQPELAGRDSSGEKLRANRENISESSHSTMEDENRSAVPEVKQEYEGALTAEPEVRSNLHVSESRRKNKNRSSLPKVKRERERILTEKPEVQLEFPLEASERVNSPEISTSVGVLEGNSVPSSSGLREIGSNLCEEPSGIYVDASSREFLNGASLQREKRFSRSSKSARGSSSSPLQQQQRSIVRTLPRRGSSLDIVERSTTRPERSSKNRDKPTDSSSAGKTWGQPSKWTDITIGRTGGSARELPARRSRSYATPRESENSPRCHEVAEPNEPRRLVVKRKSLEAVKRRGKDEKLVSPVRCASSDRTPGRNCLDAEDVKPATSRSETGSGPRAIGSPRNGTGNRASASASGVPTTEIPLPAASSDTSNDRTAKESLGDSATVARSERSTLARNSSRSCIPVLRSRLEAVRGHEKRAKSPARCPLTMSTSSWNQENRSARASSIRVEPNVDGSLVDDSRAIGPIRVEDRASVENEKRPDRRTVIYVNVVTEREHNKSATRIVDPKKFLEYLKDRELKIQSVQDDVARNDRSEIGVDSPRILTVVSSAVDERMSEGCGPPRGSWSLRVERREIEVSAKPSVIDTSTSISDLPDTQSLTLEHPKFQIFEVPKELTKDEYIVLLESLNRDPNLEQLREMRNLCDKLGLGFNE